MSEPAHASQGSDASARLLIQRVQAGDQTALELLFLRFLDPAYRVALRQTGNTQDAEDAVQSAFLHLLSRKAAAGFRGQASVKGWIMSIVLNACRESARSSARRRNRERFLPPPLPRPDQPEQNELQKLLRQKVQELPEDFRVPVWLHYLEHFSLHEVGEALGLSDDAAAKRVSRGLEKLRGMLAGAGSAAALPALLAGLPLEHAPASLQAALAAGAAVTSNTAAGSAHAPAQGLGGLAMKITAVAVLAAVAATGAILVTRDGQGEEPARPVVRTPIKDAHAPEKPQGNDKAPLGSLEFHPSPERPIGWRSDGSGRYPGATPPVQWSKDRNVVWQSPPFEKWGKPIGNPVIVGDRIFLSTQPTTLVCLSKLDGRILWMRSNNYFDATPEAERKANPAFAETLAPLAAKLRQIENALAKDGGLGNREKTKQLVSEREKLDDEIYKTIRTLDKKYERPHPDHPTAPTPVSDGKHVWFWTGHGVAACYDLEGNRAWCTYANRVPGGGGHHGTHASPMLVGDKLIAFLQDLIAFDAKTGAVAWTVPLETIGGYNFAFPIVQCDGQPTILTIKAEKYMIGIRVADGKELWTSENFSLGRDAFPWTEGSQVVADGVAYWPGSRGMVAFQYPQTTGGKGKAWYNRDYNDKGLACSSCVFDDGLVYFLGAAGDLRVFEAATARLVYTQTLAIAAQGDKGDGFYPSLVMAGKHLYATSNAGATEVFAPGRVFKSEAVNRMGEGTWANFVFEGRRLYLRTSGGLYCIEER